MSYKCSALVKEFRESMSGIGDVDELVEIIDQGKTAYKGIFKKITKFFKDNEEDYQELLELWSVLLEKHTVSDNKEKPKKTESDSEEEILDIRLKKSLDTSDFEDIEFIKNFTKEQLCKIFGEDKLQEYEHEDHIYYEWKIKFGEFYYSIYTSDLDDDVVWILAGNEKKNKKNVDMLYKAMTEILNSE